MSLSEFELKKLNITLSKYIEKRRPPIEIRDRLDLGFRITGQSVEIFQILPELDDPTKKFEFSVAKTTYIKTQKIWKIYWMRADEQWHAYSPHPEAHDIEEVLKVIDQDENCCFWG
jgi:hypothetical protein